MRRLFLYFTKQSKMDAESEKLQRIQVDLCLALGWSKESITFVSNVPFKYNGVEVVLYQPKTWPQLPKHVKGWFISTLYNEGILKGSYWVTDHDVYQVGPLPEGARPFGVVDLAIYGVVTSGRIYHPAHEVNLCCAFVSEASVPFMERLRRVMTEATSRRLMSEERAATYLKDPDVHYLSKEFNLFAWTNMKEQCAIMKGPPIAIHFHPSHAWAMNIMCLDSSGLGFIPASPLLMDILKQHGFVPKPTKDEPRESYGA